MPALIAPSPMTQITLRSSRSRCLLLGARVLQVARHRHAEAGGDRGGGMRRAERVVFALGAAGEAGQAAALAQRADAVAPAGQDLVRIGLVADVPDQPVARGVEHRVQRHGQLDHAEAGAEMAAGDRDRVDRLGAQFVGKLAQLLGEKLRRSAGTWTRSSSGVFIAFMSIVLRLQFPRSTHVPLAPVYPSPPRAACRNQLFRALNCAAPPRRTPAPAAVRRVGPKPSRCPAAWRASMSACWRARAQRRAPPPSSPSRRRDPCRCACRSLRWLPSASSRSSAIWNAAPRSRP